MDQSRVSFLALHFTPGVGDVLLRQLISYSGSADEVFKKPKGKLLKIPGIGEVLAQAIASKAGFREAEKELQLADQNNTEILFYFDKHFPERLKLLPDAPALLYVKGNTNLRARKTVGIVGTRQATAYGKSQVEKIVAELTKHNAQIISGLAYGIDIHAHKMALQYRLSTVAVMGSGMDIIYPATHRDTAKKMLAQGALLTENRFGTKPDAHNFPARNRIIAGLCDAVIVVEAAEKGGALITADIANSYNKDVFAVPGNLGNSFSEGCNKLIKTNRAHLYTGLHDLEYIMNWKAEEAASAEVTVAGLEPDEQKILLALKAAGGNLSVDELSWKTETAAGLLAAHLLALEIKNKIVALPGKRFALKK